MKCSLGGVQSAPKHGRLSWDIQYSVTVDGIRNSFL